MRGSQSRIGETHSSARVIVSFEFKVEPNSRLILLHSQAEEESAQCKPRNLAHGILRMRKTHGQNFTLRGYGSRESNYRNANHVLAGGNDSRGGDIHAPACRLRGVRLAKTPLQVRTLPRTGVSVSPSRAPTHRSLRHPRCSRL
jgi:hypothetical protein